MCQSKADGGRRCPSSDYTVAKARKQFAAPNSAITGDQHDVDSYSRLSNDYLSLLSDEEKSAVTDYVNQEYQTVNEQLWAGEETHPILPHLDAALEKGEAVRLATYRKPAFPQGLTKDEEKELVEHYTTVGNVIDIKGYASTSVNSNAMIPLLNSPVRPNQWTTDEWIEQNDKTHKNVVFQIVSDKGRPVSTVSHMPQESEYLLPRNTKWKVVRVVKDVEFHTDKNLATGESGWQDNRKATVVQLVEEN